MMVHQEIFHELLDCTRLLMFQIGCHDSNHRLRATGPLHGPLAVPVARYSWGLPFGRY